MALSRNAWSLRRRRTAAGLCTVLVYAVGRPGVRGIIFHSDRGSEYMGHRFTQVAQLDLLQSASVRCPGDNAPAESFFIPQG